VNICNLINRAKLHVPSIIVGKELNKLIICQLFAEMITGLDVGDV
jgi:hypothetical protein